MKQPKHITNLIESKITTKYFGHDFECPRTKCTHNIKKKKIKKKKNIFVRYAMSFFDTLLSLAIYLFILIFISVAVS
jgi:hypothetical protein